MFSARRAKREHDQEALQAQLYQQIGQLKVELDWLKKKLDWPPEAKRGLIDPAHPRISIARQCELVGLSRSSFYDVAQGESAENLRLMRLLDEQYTRTPFYGVHRMTVWLRQQGYTVNPKRVARLLHTMLTIIPGDKARQRLNQRQGYALIFSRRRHGWLRSSPQPSAITRHQWI